MGNRGMRKSEFKYISEWFNAVPARWYGMLAILVILVAGIVAGITWLASKGLEWWWIGLGTLVIILFILLSFLSYRKVAIERDELKSKVSILENGIEQKSRSEVSESKPETENSKVEKKPRIVSSVLLENNQHIHNCSKCGWGFAVDRYTTGVVCPKCGNADNIRLRL